MHKKIVLAVILIIVIFVSFGTAVLAVTINELQSKREEIQSQLEETNRELEGIEIEITENLEQLNNLNEKITEYENDILTYEENLTKIEQEMDVVTKKLIYTEENYNAQVEVLQNRMVALYEAGDILYLDVLLKSNTISEFLSAYYFLDEMVKLDNELLESIETQKIRIEETKTKLQERQIELQEIKNNKEKATISLENSKIIRNSYINGLTDEERLTQEKIESAKQELNKIEAQIVLLASLNLDEGYIDGEFIWPAPGYTTITSRFGMRVHPVLKVRRIHSGTDIGMPTGSYVIASNDGVVTQSTYNVGYGNMIVIDHGGGISTLYGHGSQLIAEVRTGCKKG